MAYETGNLPLETLFGPVTQATEALARLDERLSRSPVRAGWIERQHFADAAAALWLEGELVHVEDLVLHDAHMDIRAPTHELTRAHGVLRARRLIFGHKPNWALSGQGLVQLTRRGGTLDPSASQGRAVQPATGSVDDEGKGARPVATDMDAPDALTKALQAIDAVLVRSAKVLGGETVAVRQEQARESERPDLVYDLDWDEDARLDEWQGLIASTRTLPPVLRVAILIDAWGDIEVLQHAAWLGPLLVAALLRQEGLAAHHLPSWSLGAKQIPRERRRAHERTVRLIAHVESLQQAAVSGMKEHDRLMLAKGQMERRLTNRRSNSRLPELIALVLSRPLVSSSMIQQALKVSKQGALNLVSELGLREMTGRGRFKAWGVV